MTLNKYLLKNKITSLKFSKQIRVSISSVNKWRMAGYRVPRAKWIDKIHKATNGSVRAKDWYNG